jgi:hypothetical protein
MVCRGLNPPRSPARVEHCRPRLPSRFRNPPAISAVNRAVIAGQTEIAPHANADAVPFRTAQDRGSTASVGPCSIAPKCGEKGNRRGETLAADSGHGPDRLHEIGIVDFVARLLFPDSRGDEVGDLSIRGAGAEQPFEIVFVQREQAGT